MKSIFQILFVCIIASPLHAQTNLHDNYYFTRIGIHSINEVNFGYGFRFENNTLLETSLGINLGTGIFRTKQSWRRDEYISTSTTGFVIRSTAYPSTGDKFGLSASLLVGILTKNQLEFFSDQSRTYQSINISSLAIGPTFNFWNHRRVSLFTGLVAGFKRDSRSFSNGEKSTEYSSVSYFNLALQIKFYRKEKDGIKDMF